MLARNIARGDRQVGLGAGPERVLQLADELPHRHANSTAERSQLNYVDSPLGTLQRSVRQIRPFEAHD